MDLKGLHTLLFFLFEYSCARISSVNLALHRPVSKSHGNKSANLTVDGDVRSSQRYCYFSTNQDYPWLRVDLGQVYSVSLIVIYGHSGGLKYPAQNLNGVKIYLHNIEQTKGTHQDQIPATYPEKRFYNHTFIPPVDARYVTLQHGERKNLAVCELEVYKEECAHAQFGPTCNESCQCMDNETCDHVTGTCSNGLCPFGWTGDSCDVQCPDGTFGDKCGSNCYCKGQPCNKTSGVCPSATCELGYIGDRCDQECTDNMYGNNCSQSCGPCDNDRPCDVRNGTCYGLCAAGFEGEFCTDECSPETYGQNCSEACGNCFDNEVCGYVNGSCSNCEAGYTGNTCKEKCTPGTYGQNCSKACGNCFDNEVCGHVNGSCSNCEAGYTGNTCKEKCSPGTYGQNCSETCGNCFDNEVCGYVNGSCSNCEAGYTGNTCKENCTDGFFGVNCNGTCGECADTPCDRVLGTCSNCSAGYLTEFCNETCPTGTHGFNCSLSCGYCIENTTCHHIDGHCPETCISGYTGDKCNKEVGTSEKQNDGDGDSSQTAVIGAAVAVAVLSILVAAGIVVFVLIRRRRNFAANCKGGISSIASRTRFSNMLKAELEDEHATNGYIMLNNTEYKNVDDTEKKSPDREPIGEEDLNSNDQTAETRNIYYSFAPTTIHISELWEFIYTRKVTKYDDLKKEYKLLKDGLTDKHEAAKASKNKGKNRYKGLYAYDHSRVKLMTEDEGETDYINANYIHGYERDKKFIASQGPTTAMINDFWRMIWQQKTETIVMLTNLLEMGNNKCEQYWPEGDDGSVASFGSIEVKLVNTDTFTDFDVRTLEARKNAVYTNEDCPVIIVKQYHLKSWPDKDVPDTTWCLVNFWRVVDQAIKKSNTSIPTIVHCSAGIGRTGTFIALDNLHYQAINEDYANPFEVVSKLRDQRVKMVQTEEQYIYLHEALADSLLIGTHFVWTTQIEVICLFMDQPFSNSNVTNYDQQFKRLQESVKEPDEGENEYSNMEKSTRTMYVKPSFQVSSYFQSLGSYYVPTFLSENGIILTRIPTQTRVGNFWRLVDEHHTKTIIIMSETSKNDKGSWLLGVDTKLVIDNATITALNERTHHGFLERELMMEVQSQGKTSNRTIIQYTLRSWEEVRGVPSDTQSVVDMINHVTRWQTQLLQIEPVIVCCCDGTKRSGLISVLLNECSRIRSTEDKVNIVESVKTMKDVNKSIITSSEQLRFCYEAVSCFLQKSEICENEVYQNM